MKDRVIFETAKSLKKAGFPQPRPENGQVWYGSNGDAFICLQENVFVEYGCLESQYIGDSLLKHWIFAPLATDILWQLSEKALMFLGGDFFHVGIQNGHYKADEWGWVHLAKDGNPAEAAASAWLALNKKQDETD